MVSVTVAIDWDDTLVNVKTQEWLPGAVEALQKFLAQGDSVVIFTCRANWPEGLASIEQKLVPLRKWRGKISIEKKPRADVYIDNQALRFQEWETALPQAERILSAHRAFEAAKRPSRNSNTASTAPYVTYFRTLS